MCSIMGPIRPEQPDLFTVKLGKNAGSDFDYTLASTEY